MATLEKPATGSNPSPKQVSWRTQMQRYVVMVDGQAKNDFPTREQAEAEGKRIGDAFPMVQVRIADWQADTVTKLGPTKAAAEEA